MTADSVVLNLDLSQSQSACVTSDTQSISVDLVLTLKLTLHLTLNLDYLSRCGAHTALQVRSAAIGGLRRRVLRCA